MRNDDYTSEFWTEIHRNLQYLKGQPVLSEMHSSRSEIEDAVNYLLECEDEDFLSFIEMVFQTDCYGWLSRDANKLVQEINTVFNVEDLPYFLTDYVKEAKEDTYHGVPTTSYHTVAYPQIVRKESDVLHATAMEPVLTFLAQEGLRSAHLEFLDALADYRKGDYGDCLTKCGKAFESTMKIICDRRGWSYKQTDTAAPLLRTILAKSTLDPFFEQPLMVVATLRNKFGAHGAGVQSKPIHQHVARYAVNSTAAAILLLVEETWK